MEITKIYAQELPATRFIGMKYTEADAVNGNFGAKWGEAFQTGLFDKIEVAEGGDQKDALYEDGDAYIGLMRYDEKGGAYWIGKFTAPGTPVPEGFDYIDFPKRKLGVGWAHGLEYELYAHEDEVIRKIEESGIKHASDDGAFWYFERYQCPRFTTPDENGCVTLDICVFA